ncbi:MAG TPA: hypothetical protein VF546_05425 [Pyrinomonadaceae bacterium]|jgi:hypothetical protein
MHFDADTIAKVIGVVGGALGSILSLYNFFHARRKEAAARLDEENDLSLLAAVMTAQRKVQGMVLEPEIGSDEWKRAEGLVRKGVLMRGPGGRGYCLPNTFKW